MVSASVEVELIDKGLDAIVKRLASSELEVAIGVLDDAEPYPDGTPTLTVLAVQEFGTATTPARDPLRSHFDGGGSKELGDASAKALGEVVYGDKPEAAFAVVGELGAEGVRDGIEAGLQPALKDSTRDRPGRDPRGIPLLDTGHLLSQIDSEVRED